MILQTRPPTCVVPYPTLLIEGPADSGKTWMWAQLTASPLIGRSLLLDLGDGRGDEYGDAITGTPTYELIQHDGTWSSIIGQVEAAHAEAARAHAAREKPVALCVDSGSRIWDMLKSWGNARAKGSIKHQRLLAWDPNADIRIPNNIWDDVHARHSQLLDLLTTFPGIVVITARGREMWITEDSADPVPKTASYKVDCHRDLTHAATVWIRLSLDGPPTIIGAQSKYLHITYGSDEARVVPDLNLADLIFKTLRVSADSQPRPLVRLGQERLPEAIRDDALATVDREHLQRLLTEAAHPAHRGITVDNEYGAEETLTELITRRIRSVAGQGGADGAEYAAPDGVPAAPVRAVAQPGPGGQVIQATAERSAIPPTPPTPPDPAEPAAPEAAPDPAAPLDEATLLVLQRMLADCGVTTPDQRHVVLQILTGKRLTNSRSLTTAMGAELIVMLAPVITAPEPNEALRTLMQARVAASMTAHTPAQERPAA
ncbi:hypothetical protein [Streptosporangium sp. NPDC002721]|uniref:hypothetical protein n=1 Tax=Streptosporangium sp. NPDC002721 TaxID=3366188 RepID=UPI0036CA3499